MGIYSVNPYEFYKDTNKNSRTVASSIKPWNLRRKAIRKTLVVIRAIGPLGF